MIRIAFLSDTEAIADMLKTAYDAGGFEKFGLNYHRDSLVLNIIGYIESDMEVLMVSEENDKITGTFSCYLGDWYGDNSQYMLNQRWLWVDPEYRKGGTAKELIKKMSEIADRIKAYFVLCSNNFDKRDKTNRFYKMLGHEEFDQYFMKKAVTWEE